jgi:Uma2 family endonuclease
MIQTQTKTVTFDEFAAWYPENSVRRYELHKGVIVEMPLGTGPHSRVTGFTRDEISAEIRRLKLPYFIPGDCLLKPIRDEAGYQPDVIVLDQVALANEPRWDRESIITMGSSVRLAVEVVSTNWQDDYHFKFADYENWVSRNIGLLTMLLWVVGGSLAIPNNPLSRFTSWLTASIKSASFGEMTELSLWRSQN